MLFFRSEEHLRNWSMFKPETEEGIIALSDLVKLFSANFFKRRLDPDYVSRSKEYGKGFIQGFNALEKAGLFWKL